VREHDGEDVVVFLRRKWCGAVRSEEKGTNKAASV